MSKKDKFRYLILFLLVVFYFCLFYSLDINNTNILNIGLLFYCPLLFILIVVELKTKMSKHTGWKYFFLALHLYLIYGITIKSVNDIFFAYYLNFMFFICSLYYWICGIIEYSNNFSFKKLSHNNSIYVYGLFYVISVFFLMSPVFRIAQDLDQSVSQEQEKLISHYRQLCTKQDCDETFYFTRKNGLEQKYRVRVWHSVHRPNREKCVSISNTYFDPNLHIFECENKKVKTDENAVKIQDK